MRFLKQHGRKQPFFLISSFLKPHDPFMPAARFASMFRPEEMRLPDTWGKVDLARAPVEIRESIERNVPTPELRRAEDARRRIAYYYANLAQMDDCAGRILRALEDLGLAKDTVVLYTSDHGEMLGDRGLWQKFEFYEPSCGVPLIVRAPGVSASGVCSMPLSQVSVLPTLAELCNLSAPGRIDGSSFVEQIRTLHYSEAKPVFAEYNLRKRGAKYMIRDGDYKYTFWTHDIPELYDLRKDPAEMTNLALDQGYKPKAESMKSKLFNWYQPPEITLT